MAENVVEQVGLLEVIELLERPDEIADREVRSASIAKKASSGTSPGTATVRHPVIGSSRALSSARSGMPGCAEAQQAEPVTERPHDPRTEGRDLPGEQDVPHAHGLRR